MDQVLVMEHVLDIVLVIVLIMKAKVQDVIDQHAPGVVL